MPRLDKLEVTPPRDMQEKYWRDWGAYCADLAAQTNPHDVYAMLRRACTALATPRSPGATDEPGRIHDIVHAARDAAERNCSATGFGKIHELVHAYKLQHKRQPACIYVSVEDTSDCEKNARYYVSSDQLSDVTVRGLAAIPSILGIRVEWCAPQTRVA
jgi:hypothetical protein